MILTELFYTITGHNTLSEMTQQYQTHYKKIAFENSVEKPSIVTPSNNTIQSSEVSKQTQIGHYKRIVAVRVVYHRVDNSAISGNPVEDSALRQIIMLESGGNTTAYNPRSGTYGIGQLSRANIIKYGGSGIDAVKHYIKDRYGTAANALKHHRQYGWY